MADNINEMFAEDASRIQGDVYFIQRDTGRVSALIKKETLPEGMGHNFTTPVVQRSNRTGGSGWVEVQAPDGSDNNCVPTPGTTTSAIDLLSWTASKRVEKSDTICLDDAWAAYDFGEQVMRKREEFVNTIVDLWEDRDKDRFSYYAGHKIVFNASLTEGSSTTMPATAATYQINQALLDSIRSRAIRDGAGREPYAMKNGAPLLPLILSDEAQRTLLLNDASIRNDFNFAMMGKGSEGSKILQRWGVDTGYGGYLHIIDTKMPRWNFTGGAWVEVPFYTTAAATIGTKQILNPDYLNAEYEDAFVWHPDVVHRMVPKTRTTVGADTTFGGFDYNGTVKWTNIPDLTNNPLQNQGQWFAQLYAAYKPIKVQYGYVIRFRRCPNVIGSGCPPYA
jgi:hypothetical protein